MSDKPEEKPKDVPELPSCWSDDDPRPIAFKSLRDYQEQLKAKKKRKGKK